MFEIASESRLAEKINNSKQNQRLNRIIYLNFISHSLYCKIIMEEVTLKPKFAIEHPILESLKDLQTQHGLKYENYRRYRSYCSRRLHRIRRSLNVHQGIASSAKARHQRGRKLMDISNLMVLEAGEENAEYGERILLIPLILAERAWAYAMQLKQEISEHPRRRFHLARRLKKASQHAQRFEKLCHDPDSPCTDRTKEEATAYAAYITGLYHVEREAWSEAKENLSKALSIYFKLSISIKKDEVLEHYRQRIDELRASLRYCAFSLGDQDVRKSVKVELPPTLQFHDLAYMHAKLIEQEVVSVKRAEPEKDKKLEKESVGQSQEQKKSTSAVDDEEEEEDDEFEETREAVDDDTENAEDEDEDEDEEDDDDEDDDKKQSGPRAGGVTGLVKGWLGGAWS